MPDHYYTRNPNTESDPLYWEFKLKGSNLRFKTDNGVFSKKEVDYGSRLLIETYETHKVDGLFLDVGCGYGPIGLSLAKAYPNAKVHMVDVNSRALSLAKENAEINRINNVQVYESDRLTGIAESNFDAILTNPPIRAGKQTVHEIFEQSYEHLTSEGELWTVLQKKQGAPSAVDKITEIFGDAQIVLKKKGYFIIRAKKV